MKSLRQGYGGKTPIVPHREAKKGKAVRERSEPRRMNQRPLYRQTPGSGLICFWKEGYTTQIKTELFDLRPSGNASLPDCFFL